ncbi:MAG: 23S rRNA (adenine(2503)-C(2))-methyltransferase RlmN [Candidatus Krumholzibacteriota bacterium]|nr:23S rRNA (adenine(2503)-C(2))-methyltransferase RlmN [Candidatus Krumholzibacteriota bacterium]
MQSVVLKDLTPPQLDEWLSELGEPAYRARQLRAWLYERGAPSFAAMTDLPAGLRARLAAAAVLETAAVVDRARSRADGSLKVLLRLRDGELVEAVAMPGESRPTLCLSSQAGCPLDCVFCETGRSGFARNLSPGEILDQVLLLRAELPPEAPRPNLVFMGMGEPLLNPDALLAALETLTHPEGLGYGGRRITVSTAGIPEGIRRLAAAPVPVGLALSLNAADPALRAALMPVAARHGIDELLAACDEYARSALRRVTIEYVLFAGINDRAEDAFALARVLRDRPFRINLIPYNPGERTERLRLPGGAEAELRRPGAAAVERFAGRLAGRVHAVTVRWSQAVDVGGGCGQLRARRRSRGA